MYNREQTEEKKAGKKFLLITGLFLLLTTAYGIFMCLEVYLPYNKMHVTIEKANYEYDSEGYKESERLIETSAGDYYVFHRCISYIETPQEADIIVSSILDRVQYLEYDSFDTDVRVVCDVITYDQEIFIIPIALAGLICFFLSFTGKANRFKTLYISLFVASLIMTLIQMIINSYYLNAAYVKYADIV